MSARAGTARVGSMDYLMRHHPAVGESYLHGVRTAVEKAGPLDPKSRELILLGAYTTAGHEYAFKVHCRRAFTNGATVTEVKQAVLLTFGAPVPLEDVVNALLWVDDLVDPA